MKGEVSVIVYFPLTEDLMRQFLLEIAADIQWIR